VNGESTTSASTDAAVFSDGAANAWAMVTVVINKLTNSLRADLYINGVLAKTGNVQVMGMFSMTGLHLFLGAVNSEDTPARFLAGSLDNIMFFDRALTAAEIALLMTTENLETLPVLEQIAVNILTTLNGITVAAGYNQTLSAIRSRRSDYADVPPGNNTVLLRQDDTPEEADSQRLGACDINQLFFCIANVLDSDSETAAIDTRRNQVYADMKKALMLDYTRGGYAHNTRVLPQINIQDPEGGVTGVVAPVMINYSTQENNPYTAY
jgi:hypothetical protein